MELTEDFKNTYKKLPTAQKVELLQMCADEFMNVQEYRDYTGSKKRTVYDHIKTEQINCFDFCGHKITYF